MKASRNYDDIIELPHHVSRVHPAMPIRDRAAQFAPFAALTGYEDALREAARLTDCRPELDESRRAELDLVLQQLKDDIKSSPPISIKYFKPDEKKDGGACLCLSGRVKRIDEYSRALTMDSGTVIPMENILELWPEEASPAEG